MPHIHQIAQCQHWNSQQSSKCTHSIYLTIKKVFNQLAKSNQAQPLIIMEWHRTDSSFHLCIHRISCCRAKTFSAVGSFKTTIYQGMRKKQGWHRGKADPFHQNYYIQARRGITNRRKMRLSLSLVAHLLEKNHIGELLKDNIINVTTWFKTKYLLHRPKDSYST